MDRAEALASRALQGDILAIAPPFVISDEQIDAIGDILAHAIVASLPSTTPTAIATGRR